MTDKREKAVLISAGKGLYFRNSSAAVESIGRRRILYTIL